MVNFNTSLKSEIRNNYISSKGWVAQTHSDDDEANNS